MAIDDRTDRAAIPPQPPDAEDTSGYLGLFRRNPAFARLFLGQVVSYAGDWFLTVALLDLVLDLTGSGLLAALVVVAQSLPSFVLAPLAGSAVDRFDRRRLMIVVNVISAAVALLPLLTRTPATLPFAYIGLIGISSCAAFFGPASQAALPNVVRPPDLARANILMGGTWGTMLAVGAALGGLVTAALGRTAAIVFDSASFVFAAAVIATVRVPMQERRHTEHAPFFASLREAAHYAARDLRVLALISSKSGYGISAGAIALLSVFSKEVFAAGAIGIGVLYAARGVGALLGPFVMRRVGRSDARTLRLIGVGAILHGLGYMAFALSPLFALGAAAVLVAHIGGGGVWTISNYGLQRTVPDALRGRIFAADFGLVTLTMSVSSAVAGVLADMIGPRPTVVMLGSFALLFGVTWTLWTRALWSDGAEP